MLESILNGSISMLFKKLIFRLVERQANWTKYPVGMLYLTKTTCDTIQTKKGYYLDNFDVNFIEVWVVGNDWLIWIDLTLFN